MPKKKSEKYMSEAELKAREEAKEKDAKLKKFQKMEEFSFNSYDLAEVKRDELKESVGDNPNRRVRIRRRSEGYGVVLYEKSAKKNEEENAESN